VDPRHPIALAAHLSVPLKRNRADDGPRSARTPRATGLLHCRETARHLRLCEKQVRRLISRGELTAFRFGTALRINKTDIAAYVAARRIKPVMNTKENKVFCDHVQTGCKLLGNIPQCRDSLSKY
jgi:excisionase family DNA binding protein